MGNPAGLGWITCPEAAVTYSWSELSGKDFLMMQGYPSFQSVSEEFNAGTLQMAIPTGCGVFGLGVYGYESDVDDFYNTDTDGYHMDFAYSLKICPTWTLGYGLTWVNDRQDRDYVDYEMDDGFRHTLGVTQRLNECAMWGLSGFYGSGDADTDYLYYGGQGADMESWGFDGGLALRCNPKTLLTLSANYVDYNMDADLFAPQFRLNQDVGQDGKTWGVKVGVERTFNECFVTRVGYRYQDNEYDFNDSGVQTQISDDFDYHAVSAGFGFQIGPCVTLDYGAELRLIEDDDFTHTVTMRYTF
jgi:hypothetical protein